VARGLVVAASILIASTCRLDQLVVLPRGALLCVTPSGPDTLRDSAAGGSGTARSDPISINNCGAGELHWAAFVTQGSAWLSVAPDSGIIGLDTAPPRVILNPAALDTGTYHGTVVINSTTGSGAAEIPVAFHIHPCRVTPITIDDSALATLTGDDCGAPHRPGRYARIYSFPGTANDSVSIELPASFDAYVVLDTTLDPSRPAYAETDDAALYYQRLPRNTSYYVEVTSWAAADSGAFTLRLLHPRLPRTPQALDQRLGDSVTSVAPGATIVQESLLVRAVPSDPDQGDLLHLEAEVRPVSVGFSGPNVPNGPAVANGSPAWVSLGGLADKTSYHWRVRTGDNTGRSGPWKSFGGNPDFVVNVPHPPNAPATLGQAKIDGTGILTGATIDVDVVILSAVVSDPDPDDQLRLQVEVRPVGTPFTGPTHSSDPVPDGGPLQLLVGPLPNSTSYHWRARAVDQTGDTSIWVAFGGNPDSATDFRVAVLQFPDPPGALEQRQSTDLSPIAVGGAAVSNTIVITGVVSDPDTSQMVQLEVEVELVGQSFTGQPGYRSPFVPRNSTASATIGPLVANTSYHWQARARDNAGRTGAWVPFPIAPANPETDPDFTYQVEPPVQLVFSVQPTTTRANVPIVPAVQVTALDGNGQTRTGFTGAVNMTLEPSFYGGKLTGTTTVNAVSGVATFSSLTVNKPGFGYRLRATTVQPSLTVVSAPFDVIRH
jgi:hypothetical protein